MVRIAEILACPISQSQESPDNVIVFSGDFMRLADIFAKVIQLGRDSNGALPASVKPAELAVQRQIEFPRSRPDRLKLFAVVVEEPGFVIGRNGVWIIGKDWKNILPVDDAVHRRGRACQARHGG